MKVVFIAGHEFTSPNNNGGKQGSRKLYDLWSYVVGKENVYVVSFSNVEYVTDIPNIIYFPSHHNKIEQMKNACFFRNGYNKKTEKRIVRYVEEINPDILYFDHPNTGLLLKKIKTKAKTFVFMHNIDYDYVLNKVKNESLLYYIPFLSFSRNEKYIVQNADWVMNLNERDSKRLLSLYGRSSDYLIPVTYEDVFQQEKAKKDRTGELKLLFVGSYFGPNVHGIRWFVENVMSQLEKVRLLIVGMNMERLREDLESDNVKVIGSVDDLGAYYYEADIVVIPLLYGSGMKTKTAEALMYGKKIIATDEALEGYDVEGVSDIIRANNVDEFVDGISKLSYGGAFSEPVRRLFEKNYSTETIKNAFANFVLSNINKKMD